MPGFRFSQLSLSDDRSTLSAQWAVAADTPMFAGHFPGLPIMPAVGQIALLQALIRQHSDWAATITGGSGLKFSARIQPGDQLSVRLQRIDTESGSGPASRSVRFSIANQAGPTSKGVLTLSDEPVGDRDD
jgi:3-hydroxyacyl-[acyl-carrier-protein] dehydratase